MSECRERLEKDGDNVLILYPLVMNAENVVFIISRALEALLLATLWNRTYSLMRQLN